MRLVDRKKNAGCIGIGEMNNLQGSAPGKRGTLFIKKESLL